MSVVLHELFHIAMHWGQITHISILPNSSALVELTVPLPNGYDLAGEEMAAYLITIAVLMVTALIISRIHDTTDHRSSSQILFPKHSDMHQLQPHELLELAYRANVI